MKSKVTRIKGSKNTKYDQPDSSLLLRLKSVIYRYTGIYLAHKEENKMLTSDETWKKMVKIASYKSNDMSLKQTQSLMIGSWQAYNGFARPWFRLPPKIAVLKYKYKTLKPFISLVENIGTFFLVVKWDLIVIPSRRLWFGTLLPRYKKAKRAIRHWRNVPVRPKVDPKLSKKLRRLNK